MLFSFERTDFISGLLSLTKTETMKNVFELKLK